MKNNKKNIFNQKISENYKPYEMLFFCSNSLINNSYIIDDKGFIPLLIGKGDFPRIWLYTKNGDTPIALIKDNISILPQVKFNYYQVEKRISVEIFNMRNDYIKILEIVITNEVPNVIYLDLRPIGYNIWGDKSSLNIGEGKYTNNMFQGLHTLIKLEKSNT